MPQEPFQPRRPGPYNPRKSLYLLGPETPEQDELEQEEAAQATPSFAAMGQDTFHSLSRRSGAGCEKRRAKRSATTGQAGESAFSADGDAEPFFDSGASPRSTFGGQNARGQNSQEEAAKAAPGGSFATKASASEAPAQDGPEKKAPEKKGVSALDEYAALSAAQRETAQAANTQGAPKQPASGVEKVLSTALGGVAALERLFQHSPGLSQAIHAQEPIKALGAVGEALRAATERLGPSFALPEEASDPDQAAPYVSLQHTAGGSRRVARSGYPDQERLDQAHKRRVRLSTDPVLLQAEIDKAQAEIDADAQRRRAEERQRRRPQAAPVVTPQRADRQRADLNSADAWRAAQAHPLGEEPEAGAATPVYSGDQNAILRPELTYGTPFPSDPLARLKIQRIDGTFDPQSDPHGLGSALFGAAGEFLQYNQRVKDAGKDDGAPQPQPQPQPDLDRESFYVDADTTDEEIDGDGRLSPAAKRAAKLARDQLRASGGGWVNPHNPVEGRYRRQVWRPHALSAEQKRHQRDRIDLFVKHWADRKDGKFARVTYDALSLEESAPLLDLLKPWLKEAPFPQLVRELPQQSIRHILKEHENDHIPFTRQDFAFIPEVVREGELVEVSKPKGSDAAIVWRKRVGDRWLYVVEALQGSGVNVVRRPTLVVRTAYWLRAGGGGASTASHAAR